MQDATFQLGHKLCNTKLLHSQHPCCTDELGPLWALTILSPTYALYIAGKRIYTHTCETAEQDVKQKFGFSLLRSGALVLQQCQFLYMLSAHIWIHRFIRPMPIRAFFIKTLQYSWQSSANCYSIIHWAVIQMLRKTTMMTYSQVAGFVCTFFPRSHILLHFIG